MPDGSGQRGGKAIDIEAATDAGVDDDAPFGDILASALAFWWVGAAFGLLAAVLAILWLRLYPPYYTAVMVVGPTASNGVAAMGARYPAERSVGEAGLAEVREGEALSDFDRYLAVLRSITVARRLGGHSDLVSGIFPDLWDETNGRWRDGAGPGRWVAELVGRRRPTHPDIWAIAEHLGHAVAVVPVGTTAMRRLSYRHRDRDTALSLLHEIHRAADGHLREEAARRSAAQIRHLRDRLSATSLSDHRAALASLLIEHQRITMMIDVDLPFAADAIERPFAPNTPDWPDPLPVLLGAGVAGLFFGYFVLFLVIGWKRAPGRSSVRSES